MSFVYAHTQTHAYTFIYPNLLFSRCIHPSTAVPCPKSTYVSVDKASCVPCIAGHYCPTEKLDAPVLCINGTYQNETGQDACKQCPAGQGCPSVTGNPIDCQNGTYSQLGMAECLPCPSGHRSERQYFFACVVFL